MPLVTADRTLVQAVGMLVEEDPQLQEAWSSIPKELHELFLHPEQYIGRAREKVEETCARADAYLLGK
jgi:hypothetical protein